MLTQQLENLNIGKGKNITVLSENSDDIDHINSFEKQLLAMDTPEQQASVNQNVFGKSTPFGRKSVPTAPMKHYYSRPSPQDLLYEEEGGNIFTSFSATTIYECNIDGMTEYQIMVMLHRMTMYSTVCLGANNTDYQIAEFIVAGFAGQLRGWWDNVLTLDHQRTILTATKMVRNPIKTEQGVDTNTDTVAPNTDTKVYITDERFGPILLKLQTLNPEP